MIPSEPRRSHHTTRPKFGRVASVLAATVQPDKDQAFTTKSSTRIAQSRTGRNDQSPPDFLTLAFASTECDNVNRPPSLNVLIRSIEHLTTASDGHMLTDVRGVFVDHARLGSIAAVAHAIGRLPVGSVPPLTPLAVYCLGHAFASQLLEDTPAEENVTILVGRDPRIHGMRLADALGRGAEAADPRIRVVYTGIATTPGCASFVRSGRADAAVMVTASHLPRDRNGLKFFRRARTLDARVGDDSASAVSIADLGARAIQCATEWHSAGILPPASGKDSVMCSAWVDWMPYYAKELRQAIVDQVGHQSCDKTSANDQISQQPLRGLKIVLNAGNGSGAFFHKILQELGADTTGSLHLEYNGEFPNGVPNPESPAMVSETEQACALVKADLGILLDTDADRCGFVVPSRHDKNTYEPLNRNRLIALLGVIMSRSSPGSAIVTDSVTSEGLATFLQGSLGLQHVRYLKGYANVIGKARSLSESNVVAANLAIETSGHCAFRENDYLDDGTYCAVKVLSLMARERAANAKSNLLDLIADLVELDEVAELRMATLDDSLDTMQQVFDLCALELERHAQNSDIEWEIDVDNLEGIRIRIGDGQFFMLRKSLHDPIISLQIEASSKDIARRRIMVPIIELFDSLEQIQAQLDLSVLRQF